MAIYAIRAVTAVGGVVPAVAIGKAVPVDRAVLVVGEDVLAARGD